MKTQLKHRVGAGTAVLELSPTALQLPDLAHTPLLPTCSPGPFSRAPSVLPSPAMGRRGCCEPTLGVTAHVFW